MTGRFPSEIGLRGNSAHKEVSEVPQYIKEQGLGWLFKNSGYEAVYGGKQHLPKLTAEDLGFDVITRDERDGLAESCADYIRQDREKPFLMVTWMHHTGWSIRN
jgi:arylsulfatase A-like enzyme